MPKPKAHEIKVRVSADMKRAVLALAEDRDETESLIVREALALYLSKGGEMKADDLSKALAAYEKSKPPENAEQVLARAKDITKGEKSTHVAGKEPPAAGQPPSAAK